MKLAVVVSLSLVIFLLIRRGKLNADLSLPWFLALVLLGFASISDTFIIWIAGLLDIVYPPLAIILITLFILFGLTTFLTILCSQLRRRQFLILREFARIELDRQEKRIREGEDGGDKVTDAAAPHPS